MGASGASTRHTRAMSDLLSNEALMDVAFAALDHGVDSIEHGGPLIPFVMTATGEGRALPAAVSWPTTSRDAVEAGPRLTARHRRGHRGDRVRGVREHRRRAGRRGDRRVLRARGRAAAACSASGSCPVTRPPRSSASATRRSWASRTRSSRSSARRSSPHAPRQAVPGSQGRPRPSAAPRTRRLSRCSCGTCRRAPASPASPPRTGCPAAA